MKMIDTLTSESRIFNAAALHHGEVTVMLECEQRLRSLFRVAWHSFGDREQTDKAFYMSQSL